MAVAAFLVATSLSAVPAKRGIFKTIRLADGTEVKAELRGDEFMNYWEAADGQRYVRNVTTDLYEIADLAAMRKKASERRATHGKAGRPAGVGIGGDHQVYEGEKKGLVILVEFADMPFRDGHDKALYDKILNGENFTSPMGFVGSVHDYFRDQSYGKFLLDFDIAGPVTMPKGYAYYGGNDNSAPNPNCKNIGEMLETALEAVDQDVDFSKYDWDDDGQVDQVFFLYAGRGEASGGDENTIWPHEWQLLGALGRYLVLDGKIVNTYACGCEMATETRIDGIGTICHEFSHCLGLPDMYDTDYSGGYGMASWDVMDQGSYNGNSFIPSGYSGWERAYCGWTTPVELTSAVHVDGMKSIGEQGEVYLVRNDGCQDEYYLLENRRRTGWDSALEGEGLLVVHVDYNSSVWASNGVNNAPDHQRCSPIPADGLFGSYNVGNDAFPFGDRNSLTNTTRPSASVFNKNTDGSYMMNKDITGITRNSDGTVSFDFAPAQSGILFYESFDGCAGKGGNDGVFNNIGANKNVGTAAFVSDTEGWIYTTGGGASRCAMFTGAVTTPEFELDGMARVTFNAGPLTTGAEVTALTLSASGDATVSRPELTMELGRMTSFTLSVTGKGMTSLTFTPSNIFFLDEVKIESVATTGIETLPADNGGSAVSDNRIYSIDGRYVGTDVDKLDRGMYIKNGVKFIKK